jgi:uncharacterized membrane protein YkvA (DUF1232 family)
VKTCKNGAIFFRLNKTKKGANKMTKPQTAKAVKPTRKEKSELKDRMKNLLMFLPNMVKLFGRLLTDKRVPTTEKILVVGAIVYVIMPLDFIPDVIPFAGQVDDLYLVALTLLRLLSQTDAKVLSEHWTGGGDIASLADSVANIAPMLLPKRVSRVLSAKVELTPAVKTLTEVVEKKQPLVVEIPQVEKGEKAKIASS